MTAINPEIAQLIRFADCQTHGMLGATAIADDDKRRQVISTFIKRRLQGAERLKDTLPQRRLRKSALEECLRAIRRREEDCYCPTTLILAATKGTRGLCTVCQRAREALKLWIEVERLINRRLEIQRDYFTVICAANKGIASATPPAEAPPLTHGNIMAALEVSRAMDSQDNVGNSAKKTG